MRTNLEDYTNNKKSHRRLLYVGLLFSGMFVGIVGCFLIMQKYAHEDGIKYKFSDQYFVSEDVSPENANADNPVITAQKTSRLALDCKQVTSVRECDEKRIEDGAEKLAPGDVVQNDKKKSSSVSVNTDTKDPDKANDLPQKEISQKSLSAPGCIIQTDQGVDFDPTKEVNTHNETTRRSESAVINIKTCDNDTNTTDLEVNQIVESSNAADYIGPLEQFLGMSIDEVRPLFPSFELEDYGNNGLLCRDYWLSVQFWYNSDRKINLIIIEDCNPGYSLLGIHTGMDWKEAEAVLRGQGYDFTLDPCIRCWIRPDQYHELEISVIDGKVVWFSYMML